MRPDIRVSVRGTIVEIRIERTCIVTVVVVATDIREIRSVDIAIIGERLTIQVHSHVQFHSVAVYYAACSEHLAFRARLHSDSNINLCS